jgi:hypothetical protein
VFGRYVYTRIPRNLNAAELSRKELEDMEAELSEQLAAQNLLPAADLREFLRLPNAERIDRLPLLAAVVFMMMVDVSRVLHVARLRRRAVRGWERVTTAGGIFRTRHGALERAIAAARKEASLSKRILFLSYSKKVFHHWHLIHKPFTYAFASLAVLHIGVQLVLGYFYF